MAIDGNRIRERREELGLSRAETARRAKMPLRTLEDWEAGRYPPTKFERVQNLLRVLKCSMEYLEKEEDF